MKCAWKVLVNCEIGPFLDISLVVPHGRWLLVLVVLVNLYVSNYGVKELMSYGHVNFVDKLVSKQFGCCRVMTRMVFSQVVDLIILYM